MPERASTAAPSLPGPAVFVLDQLPVSLQGLTLADTAGGARHLGAVISAALDKLVSMSVAPGVRADLESATAMLWVARDLAETLEWKLERMDAGR